VVSSASYTAAQASARRSRKCHSIAYLAGTRSLTGHRAESVAEFTHRPLYAVSSGELGTDASELEERLARILDVATVWKAVLLLDEADVFLEARSLHDVNRNALVSTFLRLLEVSAGYWAL
jgi:hypothetical protein